MRKAAHKKNRRHGVLHAACVVVGIIPVIESALIYS